MKKILFIEPFYGGSHKKLIDTITEVLQPDEYTLVTMSAKKWPWRARCSSLCILKQLPDLDDYDTLFCSSVLSLAELIGMCPQLLKLKKVVYFHENQFVYPVRTIKERDYQYGYNQITTCIAADSIVFNSKFNMDSFLNNVEKNMNMMPDNRPKNILETTLSKMSILYFPINFSIIDNIKKTITIKEKDDSEFVHIVWPHRWEFDKNPQLFFETLFKLNNESVNFQVSVLGESFSNIPEIFLEAKTRLKNNILNFGFVDSQDDFYRILLEADIVVSTADHEFFGVSVLEAVYSGCVPLVPKKLVYPELYPKECLFDSKEELLLMLKNWCENRKTLNEVKKCVEIDKEKFDSDVILQSYLTMLNRHK